MTVTHESATFEMSWHGDDKTVKNFDYTESKSGITGLIQSAYECVNGKSGKEVTVSFLHGENDPVGTKSFHVLVSASYEGDNQVSLQKILDLVGLSGKPKNPFELTLIELIKLTGKNKIPPKGLEVHIQLTEGDVNILMDALELYSEGLDPDFKEGYTKLRQRLHTAFTLAKIKAIDKAGIIASDKKLYKCTYTPNEGCACPVMGKYAEPHPAHCFAYDTAIWNINPKIVCKNCIPLNKGETPKKKIWCDEMSSCDSYNDGGIKCCDGCPAGTIVFDPTEKTSAEE